MGTKLDISTESGDVTIGSNYCEAATFTTADGKLNLNNLHMDSTVDISGTGTLNICTFLSSTNNKLFHFFFSYSSLINCHIIYFSMFGWIYSCKYW